eukprot:11381693-Alexandrium_andersonii.AAC.1
MATWRPHNRVAPAAAPAEHIRAVAGWRRSHGPSLVKLFAGCPAVPATRPPGIHGSSTRPALQQFQ